jgi:cytochrome c oxidase subunit III
MSVLAKTTPSVSKFKIHPLQFGLYLGIAGIIMMFSALISAYIVRQAAGNWLEFQLPDQFFYSTLVILFSSLTLHYAYLQLKNERTALHKILTLIGLVLGLVFIGLQYSGWLEMESIGVYLTGNPSGSFVYVLSGLHALHLLGGISALLSAVLYAFLSSRITEKRIFNFKLVLHYWHFVGVLWIYLLLFFILQK